MIEMKFCINCGSKLNDDDLFCMECGTKCNDVKEKEEIIEKEEPIVAKEELVATPIISNSKEDRLKALEEERRRLEEEIEKEKEEARKAELERERQEEANAVVPLKDETNKEEPKEETPKESNDEKEIKNNNSVLTNEENIVLIKHSLFFTALILILSVIYWFIGAFFYIHVAIRIVMIFICMGAMALPIYETVKYLISSIKTKKFNLFTLVTLGICQVLLIVLFFISISVAAS